MMKIRMEYVIYLYMVACLVLMLFNFAYMGKTTIKRRSGARKNQYWRDEIMSQVKRLMEGEGLEHEHIDLLSKKLVKTEELICYAQALDMVKSEFPGQVKEYLEKGYAAYQLLAHRYAGKESMERAYYADFISRFPPFLNEYKPLLDILISYMANSTIYCRENVLRALCVLGNVQALENAIQTLNDRNFFHHQKLLSDGLAEFKGDKEALAASLWKNYGKWNDYIMLSVIQFITLASSEYMSAFLPVLEDASVNLEVRLSIMRYYRRYIYNPARYVILGFLKNNDEDENLAIVAASVLERYPGWDTTNALVNALSDPNWYVRYNASSALVSLETPEAELLRVLRSKDRYAREILTYRLEQEGDLYKSILAEVSGEAESEEITREAAQPGILEEKPVEIVKPAAEKPYQGIYKKLSDKKLSGKYLEDDFNLDFFKIKFARKPEAEDMGVETEEIMEAAPKAVNAETIYIKTTPDKTSDEAPKKARASHLASKAEKSPVKNAPEKTADDKTKSGLKKPPVKKASVEEKPEDANVILFDSENDKARLKNLRKKYIEENFDLELFKKGYAELVKEKEKQKGGLLRFKSMPKKYVEDNFDMDFFNLMPGRKPGAVKTRRKQKGQIAALPTKYIEDTFNIESFKKEMIKASKNNDMARNINGTRFERKNEVVQLKKKYIEDSFEIGSYKTGKQSRKKASAA